MSSGKQQLLWLVAVLALLVGMVMTVYSVKKAPRRIRTIERGTYTAGRSARFTINNLR